MQASISARKRSPRKPSAWARIAAGSKRRLLALEVPHGGDERLGRLRLEPDARRRPAGGIAQRHDGLAGSAAPERDHRPSGGLGLDGHDAEVLLLGVDERTAARVEVGELGVAAAPEEADVRRGPLLEAAPRGPVSGHEQRAPELGEGAQREVLALVGHEASDEQVEVVRRPRPHAEALHRDRRVHDLGLAAPVAAHALRDGAGDRDDPVHPLGPAGAQVEAPQPGDERSGEGAPQAAAEIGVGLVPHVAHGREAVADVDGAGRRAHALRDGVVGREHEVAGRQAQPLDREGKQRQQLAVVAGGARQAREGARGDAQGLDAGRARAGHVDQREELRVREQAGELVEHALAAAQPRQPVVDQDHLHGARSVACAALAGMLPAPCPEPAALD